MVNSNVISPNGFRKTTPAIMLSGVVFFIVAFYGTPWGIMNGIGGILLPIPWLVLGTNTKHFKTFLGWNILGSSVSYGFIFGWLQSYNFLGWFILVGISVVLWQVLGVAFYCYDRFIPLLRPWFLGAIWVLHDVLKHWGIFAFPFGTLGYTQSSFFLFRSLAWDGGIFLVSFVVAFLSSVVFEMFRARMESHFVNYKEFRPFMAQDHLGKKEVPIVLPNGFPNPKTNNTGKVLVVHILVILLFLIRGTSNYVFLENLKVVDDKTVQFVQPNIDPWKFAGDDGIISKVISMDELQQTDTIDLIVWPETTILHDIRAILDDRISNSDFLDTGYFSPREGEVLRSYFLETDIPHLIGSALKSTDESGYYNAAVFIRNGTISQFYSKVELVPIAEKTLGNSWIEGLIIQGLPPKPFNWIPGSEIIPLEFDTWRIGTPICFEDIFPTISRKLSLGGANVLLGISNGEWANSESFLYQHTGLARFRSVENGIAYYRSGNSGKTIGYSPSGKVIWDGDTTEPFLIESMYQYETAGGMYQRNPRFMYLISIVLIGTILFIEGLTVTLKRGRIKKIL